MTNITTGKDMLCPKCNKRTMTMLQFDYTETIYKCYECGCWGYNRINEDEPEIEK